MGGWGHSVVCSLHDLPMWRVECGVGVGGRILMRGLTGICMEHWGGCQGDGGRGQMGAAFGLLGGQKRGMTNDSELL